MNTCTIELAADARAPACDQVRLWLREHNEIANPEFVRTWDMREHDERDLVLLAREGQQVIGGAICATRLAWLKVHILAVAPTHRGRGIGRLLMAEAERHANVRGCRYAYVDTMSYQAPMFYVRLGYQIVGEIPDWDSHAHAKFFLIKHLSTSLQRGA